MRDRPVADGKPEKNERDQDSHLRAGEKILRHASRPETHHVNHGQYGDHREGDQRLRRHGHRDDAEREVDEWRRVGRRGHHAAEKARESDGTDRDGARESGDERGPPGEKAGRRTKGLAEVDILTPRAWPQCRQLRIRHRPGEDERPADEPDAKHGPGVRHPCRNQSRHQEDTAPDHIRHDDGCAVETVRDGV